MTPLAGGLLDQANPGWLGLPRGASRAASRPWPTPSTGKAQLADVAVSDTNVVIELAVDEFADPTPEPPELAFMRLSGTVSWVFDATAGTSAKS